MKVIVEGREPIENAYARLRNSVLLNTGEDKVYYYRDAIMRLVDFLPQEINPTAFYVLRKSLEFQRELHQELLVYGIDTFHLDEVIHYRVDDGELWGMVPPVIEIHQELLYVPQERRDSISKLPTLVSLLQDGEHRIWNAVQDTIAVRCILISNTESAKFPFPAYPISWSNVIVCDKVPTHKRIYRNSDIPYAFARPFQVLRQTGDESLPVEFGRK